MPLPSLLKKCSKALIAASLLVTSATHASVVAVDFTAIIGDHIWIPGWGYDTPGKPAPTSTDILGETLSVGDTIRGRFWYDTAMPKTAEWHGEMDDPSRVRSVYHSPEQQIGLRYTVDGTNLKYDSPVIESSYRPSAEVIRGKHFHQMRLEVPGGNFSAPHADASQHAEFVFTDVTSTAFDSGELPTTLSLESFPEGELIQEWRRGAYGSFKTYSTITSLTPVAVSPVPEPETYAMMLMGLGLVGFAARRRSTAAKHLSA